MKSFFKFENTTEALAAASAMIEGKLGKGLKKFLKKELVSKEVKDNLAVADSKLGGILNEKLDIKCVCDSSVMELMRCIRSQMTNLISGMSGLLWVLSCHVLILVGLSPTDVNAMALGLSHSLSRYKLKFSPDKVDVMIVQAIALLDDIDKELNTYAMRVKEWYGWHFPELARIIVDNIVYAKVIKLTGFRTNVAATDYAGVLPEELENEVKQAAMISMGTEINEEDLENISMLCDQIISMGDYRSQLFEYLKNRMNAIAPNLTCMVGELVGARLIAHAGSLMNLAKHPASTVQILGAEKALFRALKTKHDTPKYGLIYHASLIGQAGAKNKGKISRTLAAKTALSIRVDALGDKDTPNVGIEARAKVEARLRHLEGGQMHRISGSGKSKPEKSKYAPQTPNVMYNIGADSTLPSKNGHVESETLKAKEEKRKEKKEKKSSETMEVDESSGKSKKRYYEESEENGVDSIAVSKSEKKKKKKAKETDDETSLDSSKKKKKKKQSSSDED